MSVNNTGNIAVTGSISTNAGQNDRLDREQEHYSNRAAVSIRHDGTLTTASATSTTPERRDVVGRHFPRQQQHERGDQNRQRTSTTLTVSGITQSGTTAGSDVTVNQTGNMSVTGAISTTAAANGNIGLTTSGGMTIGAGVTAGGAGALNLIANPTGDNGQLRRD